jgi:hypothetical protein
MSSRAEFLAQRRSALLERSDRLRAEIGADAAALETRFAVLDRIVVVSRSGWVRTLLTGVTALLMVTRTGRLIGLASRLLFLYQLLGGGVLRRGLRLLNRQP